MSSKVKQISKRDLIARFEADPIKMMKEARNQRVSLTGWMETLSPRDKLDELDSFGIILKERGIRTKSDFANGIYASRPTDLVDSDDAGKVLMCEIIERAARAATYRSSPHTSQEAGAGDALRPYYEGMWHMDVDIAPQVPLQALLRKTIPIQGRDYRKPIIINDDDAFTEQPVAEGANLPEVTIQNSENQVRLNKRGLMYRFTYDFLRTTDLLIDHVVLLTMEIAIRREIGKVNQLINVLQNGDGNPDTAGHVHNIATIGGSSGTFRPEDVLRFRKLFDTPYSADIFLMDEETAVKLETLKFNNGFHILQLANEAGPNPYPMFTPINMRTNQLKYAWLDTVPANTIIAIDRARSVEHIVQQGSQLMEHARNIEDQTQAITSSETYSYSIYQQNACRILKIVH